MVWRDGDELISSAPASDGGEPFSAEAWNVQERAGSCCDWRGREAGRPRPGFCVPRRLRTVPPSDSRLLGSSRLGCCLLSCDLLCAEISTFSRRAEPETLRPIERVWNDAGPRGEGRCGSLRQKTVSSDLGVSQIVEFSNMFIPLARPNVWPRVHNHAIPPSPDATLTLTFVSVVRLVS